MLLKATVELYTGNYKETVNIVLSEEELKEIFEKKAMKEYHCDSSKTTDVDLSINVVL